MKKDRVRHRASTSRRFASPRSCPTRRKYAAIWRITFSKCSASIASSARFVERLRTLGELDNTLIVITADNGMPFPRAKANVYDAGARVPFAMRWPGRAKAGLVSNAFISLSDLAPTFLEAAGLKPPAAMSARSILGLAAGGSAAGRDKVFLERERHAQRPQRRSVISGSRRSH